MLMDLNAWTRKAAPYLVVVSIRTLHILNGWTLYVRYQPDHGRFSRIQFSTRDSAQQNDLTTW